MPAICSDCGKKLGSPIRAGGNQYKCKACGGITEFVVKAKTCARCNLDLTQQYKVDSRGNHYCETCWLAAMEEAEGAKRTGRTIVCRSDHVATGVGGGSNRIHKLSRVQKTVVAAGTTAFLLALGFGSYVLVFRDRWEDQNRRTLDAILIDADSLAHDGQLEKANAKYEELFRHVGLHEVRDANLRNQLKSAKESAKRVAQELESQERERQGNLAAEKDADRLKQGRLAALREADRIAEMRQGQERNEAESEKRNEAQLQRVQKEAQEQRLTDQRQREAADPTKGFKAFLEEFNRLYVANENKWSNLAGQSGKDMADIRYDVQQTNSLVTPIVAVCEFNEVNGTILYWRNVIRFAFVDGKWTVTSAQRGVGYTNSDEQKPLREFPIGTYETLAQSANANLGK